MNSLECKKLALLRILQIFERYSDIDHPLKQEDIAAYLEKDYGIVIERKAVGRNVALLKETGIEIEPGRNGSYLVGRTFEDSELRMLIDGVLSSKYISAKHSKQLIDKLCGLSNKYFRSHVKNVYSVNDWNKTDNSEVFLNIEIIDEAIERCKCIQFDYSKYCVDKKLQKSASHVASPYQLILHNQRYYLMALNEKWGNMGYYRLDRINNMNIVEDAVYTNLRSVEGYKNGINYREISASLPYMFTDKPETVVFYSDKKIIDQIVDWFGFDVRIDRIEDRLKVTLRVSPNAMEYWAMQYLNFVEIVSPASLRDKIKDNLATASKKYGLE